MGARLPSDDLLDRYLARGARTVPGYLRSLDLDVICTLGRWQSRVGLRGGLAEIGVHHGKLFLALAALRQPGERAIAVDLFEDDGLNGRGRHAGRATALAYHARRLAIPLDDQEVIKADSARLRADALTSRAGELRLVSVDGDHRERGVSADLELAAGALAAWGIIAVDDFLNPHWPDVQRATTRFLERRAGEFGAFLVTPGKLYLARREWLGRFGEAVRAETSLAATRAGDMPLLGQRVLRLSLRWPQRLRRLARNATGLPAQYRHRLLLKRGRG